MYHPNSRFHRAICCLLFTIVAWPGAALAGALVYEGFAYPPGMPLPGMPLGVGWSAPWVGSGQMLAAPPTLGTTFFITLPVSVAAAPKGSA